MWLSLKKFNQNSLDKIKRNSPRLTKRKRFRGQKADKDALDEHFSFRDSHRLTASHPELSYSNLAQLSNYQSLTSFDDINLITVHHNSENYISDNIEFHKAKCCSIAKCQNGSICGNEAGSMSADGKQPTVAGETGSSGQRGAAKPEPSRTTSTFKSSGSLDKPASSHEKASKPQLSLSGTSSPTSFFSRFRSASPNRVNSISESVKETDEERQSASNYRPLPSLNSITTTSCSTFLPKRPHSSLNYSDTTSDARRVQYKQTEAFSASEEDLLLDGEQQPVAVNCATPASKRRDSFLLKLLKKRKSSERNPLDRVGSATNYEYYNQSLDEDYENSISLNVSVLKLV